MSNDVQIRNTFPFASAAAHDHDHDAEHPHAPVQSAEDDAEIAYWDRRTEALVRLLARKGHLTADDVRRHIELIESRTPMLGARVVARAWTSPDYKRRLLDDATSALRDFGLDYPFLVVVENTPEVHNLVVCTLCSCYPWPVLGLPPTWYKMPPYRSRAVSEPRKLLAELGLEVPAARELRVWDSSAEMRYMVLPERPAATAGLGEADLVPLITRDALIGVAEVPPPA